MFYHGPQPNDDSRARNHLRVFTININPEKTGYSIYSYIYIYSLCHQTFLVGMVYGIGFTGKNLSKSSWGHLGAAPYPALAYEHEPSRPVGPAAVAL